MKPSRFRELSRTELYALANALWWAMTGDPHPRTDEWYKLEVEVRAEAYRKSNSNAIAAGVRKAAKLRAESGRKET